MKRRIHLHFACIGWILIFTASCGLSNQKEIVRNKEKVELSVEDILMDGMLDTSNSQRKIFNRIAGFNGETYKKPIKYYIHDKTGRKNFKILPSDNKYTYKVSDDAEKFIVETFEKIDQYIDLDFKRVYSARKATINIYQTEAPSGNMGWAEGAWWKSPPKYLVEIAWMGDETMNPKLKNYPTLSTLSAYVLLHEIGHALGLEHKKFDPGDYRINIKDTIMSYRTDGNSLSDKIFFTDLDIKALRTLWGVEKNN